MLRYFPGGSEQFLMEKTDGAFKLIEKPIELEKHVQMKSGVIDSSLFAATDSAGVPDNVTTQIVDIFLPILIFIGTCARVIDSP